MTMRVTIKDKEALQKITVIQLKKYLLTSGWIKSKDFYRPQVHGSGVMVGEIWVVNQQSPTPISIFVPNNSEFSDYVARISEFLMALERVENRSQLDIYVDITGEKITVTPSKNKKTKR